MTFSRRNLFLALLVIAGALVAVWFSRGVKITTATTTRGDVAEVVYATGTIEPFVWSKVLPLLRARIVEHCACEGKFVHKGDVLARLDDTAAQAELRQIVAKRDFAISDVKRLTDLLSRGATTRLTLEKAETDLRQLESQVAALTARLTDYQLVAPKDGVVLRADGQVGDIPQTADVLFWVGQPKPLQVVADVNEEDIAKVVAGQVVLLRNDGFPQGGLKASVGAITPKGDPTTKTFRVYLTLPEETPLRIGMSVEANIVTREKKAALLAPAEALRMGASGQATAFVVDGKALRAVQVQTGIRGARLVEILSGLEEGAVLAAPLKPDFKDRMGVRIAP